jgi:uncharacterized secreted protein with C-terminal beta-propeller domain
MRINHISSFIISTNQVASMFIRPLIIIMFLLTVSLMAEADSNVSGNDSLIEISSESSFKTYLENQTTWYNEIYSRNYSGNRDILSEYAAMPASTSAPPPSLQKDAFGGAADYSTTNVQVTGVDEADFLKNDGKYLYMLHDGALMIIEVFPVEAGKIVSSTKISGNPSGLFLNGNKLVVFSSEYGETWRIKEGGIAPVHVRADITHALIYDVSDHARPRIAEKLTLPGSYENGRMIGDVIYAITKKSSSYPDIIMPIIYKGNEVIARPSIWCPPIPLNTYVLYTITSFDLTGSQDVQATSFLMGWDNTLYVSPDNVYMAYKKWHPYWWNLDWRSLSSMRPDNGEESVIHRFSISNETITYRASGTVPGYLLNQFSLDESAGNLRVATTDEQYQQDGWIQDNNVYILSPDLAIIGRLEHLAPGEKIYSARFIGDLLYLVTFKQTDPLFVIDLSNPDQPGILGELKIPGYSDYLHPYDSKHLIGIGKDTEENQWGGVIPTGVKVALFDVSDLNNPKLVDSRIIGEKGSTSEVLHDHKAFLLDKKRSIMVLPMKEVLRIPIPESTFKDSYTTASWQGAYVLGIDPTAGFSDIGKIEQDQVRPPDYYGSGLTVRRSVVMDQILYTVSDNRIIGSDIEKPESRLLFIDFPEQNG